MAILENKEKRQQLRQEFYRDLATEGITIPDAIKKLRKILGLDQAKFSKMVGISLSALRRIEQNHDNYTIGTLSAILNKFDLELTIMKKSNQD